MIRPYIYAFDADTAANGSPLTGGASYENIPAIRVQDCDRFILSRIAGIANVCSKFRLYDPNGYPASSAAIYPVGRDMIVMPSYIYPANSRIGVDLQTVSLASRATGGTPNYYSQIAFQGQKHLETVPDPETKYRWRPVAFHHVYPFTLSWEGRVTPGNTTLAQPRRFQYRFSEYDFELHQLRFYRTGQTAPAPAEADFKVMIYDSYMNPLSNVPVLDSYVNAGSVVYNSSFPAPAIVYPVDSAITFDIWSLQTTANLPRTFQIEMIGVWRQAC